LVEKGLEQVDAEFEDSSTESGTAWNFETESDWLHFVREVVPALRSRNWQIEIDETFQFRIVEATDWYSDAAPEPGHDWFGVELGVEIEGQKVNLLPILVRLIQESPSLWTAEALAQLPGDAAVLVPLP